MTLTKSQKIKELEAQLEKKDRKIRSLEDQVAAYQMKFEDIQKAEKAIPTDCKPGEYCKACIFSSTYMFRNRWGDLDRVHFCTKAKSCENFAQKEVND